MKPIITFGKLPETVKIDGIVYPVGFGYRTMMAVEIEMFGEQSDEQKLLNALNLFYLNNIPPNREAAVEQLLWFFRCGEPEKGGAGGRKVKRGYCFERDAPLLYAAFRQQYGIDLRRTNSKELHWWEFSALFEALDEETKMAKVIYWRTCDTNGMSKNQKQFIAKMRKIYSLKDESTLGSRLKLSQRNAAMKDYVKKRAEECRKE